MDLKTFSGLPIEMDEGMNLVYPHTVRVKQMTARTCAEMLPFLQSENVTTPQNTIYRVYHEVAMMDDTESIQKTGLRYDLTAIQAGVFHFREGEDEFFRTAGHYHPRIAEIDYPEVYEVLAGRGRWIIQKYGAEPSLLEEVYLVEAGPGEKICIPPNFGHITINAENAPLIISNVIKGTVGHNYRPFQELKGGGYRLLASRDPNMIEIERNGNYRSIPDLLKLKPKKDWYHGYFNPVYRTLATGPEQLVFLENPKSYNKEFFAIDRLYSEIK